MNPDREMNYEIIRARLVAVFEEYMKPATKNYALEKMKEIVKEYDDIVMLLDETLNCSIGIMDALSKGEIKDKAEEESVLKDIIKELNGKNYLGASE